MHNTRMITVDIKDPERDAICEAAEIIRNGGLVAFPTETVYGLGANALDERAAARIYAAKGRPQDNPLIVHIRSISDLESLVEDLPAGADKLMKAFWPGPLTILFRKKAVIPAGTTAGLDTVAIRMPDHRIALELIKAAGVPIAAPSANISGKPIRGYERQNRHDTRWWDMPCRSGIHRAGPFGAVPIDTEARGPAQRRAGGYTGACGSRPGAFAGAEATFARAEIQALCSPRPYGSGRRARGASGGKNQGSCPKPGGFGQEGRHHGYGPDQAALSAGHCYLGGRQECASYHIFQSFLHSEEIRPHGSG